MSGPVAPGVAALISLFLGCLCCAQESSTFTLDIETLRQLSPENSAGITYDEDQGTLLVTVIDKHGDGHIHRLLLADMTRPQALELLRKKPAELERRK